MSFRRVGRLAAMVIPTLLCLSCGQVYRPVVIPCSAGNGIPNCPVETPPTPANFHAVFGLSVNVPGSPGGAMEIDVAGDSIIAETSNSDPKFGENPTHVAILPNDTRLFVASAGSAVGGVDLVSSFSPAFQSTTATGFGSVSAISLPSQVASIASISEDISNVVTVTLSTPLTSVAAGQTIVISGVAIPACSPSPCTSPPQNAYDGAFTITSINSAGTIITYTDPTPGLPALSSGGTATFPPQPVFLNSTQTNAMYVANYNSNSVSAINTTSNFVSNTKPVGVHPVALAETPNGSKIYVANEGDNTVSSLNVADLSSNKVTDATGKPFSGNTPVWVVARGDSQRVYVLTEGDGQLVTIDTATDMVTSSLPVGAGANFVLLDPHLNRLYVANPATNQVYVFSDTGGANDTPSLLTATPLTIPGLSAATTPACSGCNAPAPISVSALADGSRFYVASYQIAATCPDTTVSSASCVIPLLTVFDAASLTPRYGSTSTLTLLTSPFAVGQFSVPLASACASPVWPAVYAPAPSTTRFRVFTTAAADSSHVYVSMCDAGAIADIITTNNNANGSGGSAVLADTLIADLPAAFSNGTVQSNGEPPNQNPIFLLTGQ